MPDNLPSPVTPADFDLACVQRAAYLASTALGTVSPNPQVGAVLAIGGRIVSEGLYRRDGGPHAEIDALSRLPEQYLDRLAEATIYVSLEPCSIYGRTPPCAARLVREGVGRVLVAALDFTPGVCGAGLMELRSGGAEVVFGLGQATAFEIARPRNVFATQARPYVVLKQAVSSDGFVGRTGGPVPITAPMANVLSHRWRAEQDAILIGSRTFSIDRPALTSRLVAGRNPHVVVFDPSGRLSPKHVARHFESEENAIRKVFYASAKPVTPTTHTSGIQVLSLDTDAPVRSLLSQLAERKIGRLLVEGGPSTLRAFVTEKLWDEYREWRSPAALKPNAGAPVTATVVTATGGGPRYISETHQVGVDTLRIFTREPR